MATEFQKKVWDAVESIPGGNVTTYGAIAKAVGTPHMARYITGIIAQHPQADTLPWHRIVYANGTVWISPECENKRKMLYKKEGIKLKKNKITNFNDVLYTF